MKTKETNPTRPGSLTPCKQALIPSLQISVVVTYLFLFFPDKDIKRAWDYKMRNVRKKLPQLLIAVTLVVLTIMWIIHPGFLAPVDRLPDNQARRLSLERTRVPSQDPHTKPRNLSERKQYQQSFAGKICANAIFTRGSGSTSIILNGQI